jgi:hypothetical protein
VCAKVPHRDPGARGGPWRTRSWRRPPRRRRYHPADDGRRGDDPLALTWNGPPREPGPAVVVDLDGTLSDAAGRQHHLERRPKDWDGFFAAVGDDSLIDQVARLVELLDRDLVVVLLTARPVRVQDLTVDWLGRHGVRWDLLVMREERDFRPSHEAKLDAVRALRGVGFDLRLAVDDDPRNAAMFRAEGVPCLELDSGYDA